MAKNANEIKVGEDGRPTAAQIKEWKSKFGNLNRIVVGDEDCIAIVREPKLRDLKQASAAGKMKSDIDVAEVLYNNCKLYEDEDIRKYDSNYMAAIGQMGELIEVKEARLEKI